MATASVATQPGARGRQWLTTSANCAPRCCRLAPARRGDRRPRPERRLSPYRIRMDDRRRPRRHLGSGADHRHVASHDACPSGTRAAGRRHEVCGDDGQRETAAQRRDALAADADLVVHLDATTVDHANGLRGHGSDDIRLRRVRRDAPQRTRPPPPWASVADSPTPTLSPAAPGTSTARPDRTLHSRCRQAKITVATTEPERRFTVTSARDATVTLSNAKAETSPDLVLPAEAFVRLVYGRLDPDHLPVGHRGIHLDSPAHLPRPVAEGFRLATSVRRRARTATQASDRVSGKSYRPDVRTSSRWRRADSSDAPRSSAASGGAPAGSAGGRRRCGSGGGGGGRWIGQCCRR